MKTSFVLFFSLMTFGCSTLVGIGEPYTLGDAARADVAADASEKEAGLAVPNVDTGSSSDSSEEAHSEAEASLPVVVCMPACTPNPNPCILSFCADAGTCQSEVAPDLTSCPSSSSGSLCVNQTGQCTACGGLTEGQSPCCGGIGGSCNASPLIHSNGWFCGSNGFCNPCGAMFEACCPSSSGLPSCAAGYTCMAGTCQN